MDNSRFNEKVIELEEFLEELEDSLPEDFEDYKTDYKLRAIGERYFEKIIKAVIDLSFMIIKIKKFKQPEQEKEVFDILVENNIITISLSKKLQDAKGMRNIIAHEYGRIDNELVFHSLADELIPDVREFINSVNKIFL
jgi:uncharacterized protein YutE (UPF0331/DUF86 family)